MNDWNSVIKSDEFNFGYSVSRFDTYTVLGKDLVAIGFLALLR